MKLYQRFILEPRSPYTNHGNNGKCYLVVYDKKHKILSRKESIKNI